MKHTESNTLPALPKSGAKIQIQLAANKFPDKGAFVGYTREGVVVFIKDQQLFDMQSDAEFGDIIEVTVISSSKNAIYAVALEEHYEQFHQEYLEYNAQKRNFNQPKDVKASSTSVGEVVDQPKTKEINEEIPKVKVKFPQVIETSSIQEVNEYLAMGYPEDPENPYWELFNTHVVNSTIMYVLHKKNPKTKITLH